MREKNYKSPPFSLQSASAKYIVRGILDCQIGCKNNQAKFVAVLFSLLVATHAPTTHIVSFDKIINLALQGVIIIIIIQNISEPLIGLW